MKKISLLLLISIIALASIINVNTVNAARVGVQSVSGYLTVLADGFNTLYYTSGYFDIGSSASAVATLYVQGFAGSATSTFAVASSTGQKIFNVSSSGTTTIRQYIGFGTPTVATSTGSGTPNATSTLATGSTDVAGSIYIVTGSLPAINATIATFTSASSTLPFCTLQPMTTNTASYASSTSMGTTTTGFTINSGSTPLIATTTYQWNYLCN